MLTTHSFSYHSLGLCDAAAPRELFGRVAHQPWAMLLESAAPEHPDSHFHLLCADPLATLQTRGMITRVVHGQDQFESDEDPLALLDNWLTQLLGSEAPPSTLPFAGGAMGLWGYDLGRRFEHLPVMADADIQVPDMAVGIYDWAWILEPQALCATLLVIGDEAAWQRRYLWWQQQQAIGQPPFSLTSPWRANMSRQGYADRFSAIQAYLRAGDCYQINLTQRFSADYHGDEWQAYCDLSARNGGPFSAFLRLPHASLLSFSPERFLLHDGRAVSTKPIKGTRPRGKTPEEDQALACELQEAEKDQAENLMIVDLLRNDIGKVCQAGSVQVPSLFAIESFPAVHHLVSTVTGILDARYSACDLLRACFPGGSITGAPKVRAMEIIEELEPHRRNGYCGSIGYISAHGRMDTSITIRTIIAQQGQFHLWAGGGIVADSDVESEYAETFHKLGKIIAGNQVEIPDA